jgi:thiol-disulfide isomerase/thioredoxin
MKTDTFKTGRMCGLMLYLAIPLFSLLSCGSEEAGEAGKTPTLSFEGRWRGVLETAGGELPFFLDIMEVKGGRMKATVQNGPELLPIGIVEIKEDVIKLFFEQYNSYLEGKMDPTGRMMKGHFSRHRGKDFKKEMKFTAYMGQKSRFLPKPGASQFPDAPADISGEWNVVFGEGENAWEGHAILKQVGKLLTGTMLTEVGDFRFMAGSYEKGVLRMSVFDGAHCFLFHATLEKDEVMEGHFYSGAKSHTPWTAKRGKNRLRDPYSLTKITNEEGTFSFKFPDANGKEVSSEDPKFKGKPLVVCILGTWCPNCHDEGPYLAGLYKKYHPRGLEMVSLACEFSGDHKQDSVMVRRFTRKYKISWPILIVGTSNKEEVAKALPDLNTFLSYPTTLFIDRNGKVQKIHTGFTGPGTGKYYDELRKEFEETIEALL